MYIYILISKKEFSFLLNTVFSEHALSIYLKPKHCSLISNNARNCLNKKPQGSSV